MHGLTAPARTVQQQQYFTLLHREACLWQGNCRVDARPFELVSGSGGSWRAAPADILIAMRCIALTGCQPSNSSGISNYSTGCPQRAAQKVDAPYVLIHGLIALRAVASENLSGQLRKYSPPQIWGRAGSKLHDLHRSILW